MLDLTLINRNAENCVSDWYVSDVPSFSDQVYIRLRVQSGTKRTKMIKNVRRTCWNKYANELDHRLHDLNSTPVSISSVDDIEKLASTVQSKKKLCNLSCPQRKIRRKSDNIWWNTELTCLRREARKAQRKAIKSKLGNDWEAFKQAQLIFKNAVRKAKRDSWGLFTELMNSYCATARLAKVMRRNEMVQESNVLRPNGEFTKSSVETTNCPLDTLAPGSREVSYSKAAAEPNDNTVVLPRHDEIVSSICSLEKMERAINEFLPFKTPGPDGIYPVLLQKGWNSIRNTYQTIVQMCLKYSYVPKAWKEGTGIFIPKPGKGNYHEVKSFRMITLTSFQLKWLERLVLYHFNDDSNLQASFLRSSMDSEQEFQLKLHCTNLHDAQN